MLLLAFTSCNGGVSKDRLTKTVRADIETAFSKKATENGMTYSINSFNLVHDEGNRYTGILKSTENGNEFTYQVDVIVDGDSYVWKIVDQLNNDYQEDASTDEEINQPTNEEQMKVCSSCDGTGIITCKMCDGTGINNMGMDCGCVTYVANSIAMGKTPTRTALQWTCEDCDGTGYVQRNRGY